MTGTVLIASNDWEGIPPIPSTVHVSGVLKRVAQDNNNSTETIQLCKELKLGDGSCDKQSLFFKFLSFIWKELEKIVFGASVDQTEVTVVDKKHWKGHSFPLFQLQTSIGLKQRWHEILYRCGCINIPSNGIHPIHQELLFKRVQQLYTKIIGKIYNDKKKIYGLNIANTKQYVASDVKYFVPICGLT